MISLQPVESAGTTGAVGGRPTDEDAGQAQIYEPALDGIRGIAVAAVLAFHGGFAWAKGGYLGVSTFFTLSGFLITRVMLREHQRTGRVALRRFWVRRARRLWPASLATLALVAVAARVVFDPAEVAGLRADLLASLAQVANWRFIADARSYGALFESPSLVQHFWSLAIEEQFYVVLPLVVVACTRRRRNPITVLAGVTGLLALASMAVTLVLAFGTDVDRTYYGTDGRAFELLAGVLLALVCHEVDGVDRPAGRASQIVGWTALAASAVAWVTVAQTERWVTQGGLWGYAALSVALIIGARSPGALNRLLASPPLRGLGLISYGVYLLHWPIFRALSPERLNAPRWLAFALGVAITVSVATVSHSLLEHPIRTGRARWLGHPPRPALVSAGAFAVVVLLVSTVVPDPSGPVDLGRQERDLAEILAAPGRPVTPGAPRVGFFGDSTALATALGVISWANRSGELEMYAGSTPLGCGLVTEGTRRYLGRTTSIEEKCAGRDETYRDAVEGLDVAVFMAGAWETAEYRSEGAPSGYRSILDDSLWAEMDRTVEHVHDLLTSGGEVVMVWVLVPDIEAGVRGGRPPAERAEESDPRRIERYNDLGRALAERHPDDVRLLDFRGWMEQRPGGPLDRDWRADGIHLSEATATVAADAFFGPAILDAAR